MLWVLEQDLNAVSISSMCILVFTKYLICLKEKCCIDLGILIRYGSLPLKLPQ